MSRMFETLRQEKRLKIILPVLSEIIAMSTDSVVCEG